jgi:2'-5' RNA ligase
MHTDGLLFFGAGVAYRLLAPEAVLLRQNLAQRWADWLVPQDQKSDFTPHITIQNKVKADTARALYDQLTQDFKPQTLQAIGVDVWHYRGGPWEPVGSFAFVPVDTAL